MKDNITNGNPQTPQKPNCPFCQGEVIYPEFKEGCPPEPPKCSKCGKYIPPPGEFHPFFAGFGFDFYNDPHNFGPRHHRRGMSPPKCKNCDTIYPPLEFKSGEPIKMPKCSFCETEMEPPKYLPRCKNCDTLYPFPIYKPGEPPIMPKCSFCDISTKKKMKKQIIKMFMIIMEITILIHGFNIIKIIKKKKNLKKMK